MTKMPTIAVLLIAVLSMTACSTTSRIQSDYAESLNFGGYSTFDFASPVEFEEPDLAEDLQLYFSAAIMQELQARGLERAEHPDILIDISVRLDDVSRWPVNGLNCPSYEDYFSSRLADSFSGQGRRPMCVYSEGSVSVALTDVAKQEQVMEAVSRVRLDERDRGNSLLRSVSYDVATMFGNSPVRDGRPVPSVAVIH